MPGMADLTALIADLRAEHAELDAVVAGLPLEGWDRPTPADPWTVRDQISHLTFFDEAAAQAVSDPDGFVRSLEDAAADVQGYMDAPLVKGRGMEPAEVLGWWRSKRAAMLDAFAKADPAQRVPWYGPPMSPASFMSARLMETWAHGQDIFDALGLRREPTARLRHVVHLGVRARGYSYVVNGMAQPPEDVRVELSAPDGEVWSYGESDENRIVGPALDFCLVVTQRRHLADTSLVIEGPAATEWMSIAQCFAGPPGAGRVPGQFADGSA